MIGIFDWDKGRVQTFLMREIGLQILPIMEGN